jgi:hypothetical protein
LKNVKDLQKFVWGLGWFSKSVKLTITWEKQVVIQIESPDETICPNIKVVGHRFEDIDTVAHRVLQMIETWKHSTATELKRTARFEHEKALISQFQLNLSDRLNRKIKKVFSKDNVELKYQYSDLSGYINIYGEDLEKIIVLWK